MTTTKRQPPSERADWTFKSVAGSFDSHVQEQLPWYHVATELTRDIARHFITPWSTVYDLGAATGNIGRALGDVLLERSAAFIPIESERSMADTYDGPGALVVADASQVEFASFSLAVSFLTAIFLDVPARARLIRRLTTACAPGGAIVFVERMTPTAGYLGLVFARTVLAQKVRAGADPGAAMTKEISLSGVQRPLDPTELPDGSVEFFRAADFAGYVWVKPSGLSDRS